MGAVATKICGKSNGNRGEKVKGRWGEKVIGKRAEKLNGKWVKEKTRENGAKKKMRLWR